MGLSIKDLDDRKKEELRELMEYLHATKGLSLNDIAKMIGNKTSGYTSWLCRQLGVRARPFEEARLKGIREKRRKYERRPFDGTDEDKAYLLGLKRGDLSASIPWKGAVRVSTSTTHPAMAELFRRLFEAYGHVYQHPRYKEEMRTYEWNLSAILDETFGFLLMGSDEMLNWVLLKDSTLFAFLSGLLDSDGSIIVTKDNRGLATIFLDFYGSDKPLLEWIKLNLEGRGFVCSLRLNKPKGYRTKKYGIIHRGDHWQLSSFGLKRVQGLLTRIRPLHREKVTKMKVALSLAPGTYFADIETKILGIEQR
jgi:hypothetical protein